MMTGLSKSAWLIACATLALMPSMTAAQTSAPTPSAAQAPDWSGDASLDIVVTAHIDSSVGGRGLPDVAGLPLRSQATYEVMWTFEQAVGMIFCARSGSVGALGVDCAAASAASERAMAVAITPCLYLASSISNGPLLQRMGTAWAFLPCWPEVCAAVHPDRYRAWFATCHAATRSTALRRNAS